MLNLDTHILIPLVARDRNIRNSKIVPLTHAELFLGLLRDTP